MNAIKENINKIILITGVTGGIGKQLTLKCAQVHMKMILVARNEQKIKNLLQEIKKIDENADVSYYIVDLSILQDVYKVGKKIVENFPKIDILVNNAGVFTKEYSQTSEGYELTLATNYLSPFLLTLTLLPSLRQSDDAHVLNVSSLAHLGGGVHKNQFLIRNHNYGFRAYNQSKLLILMFSFELARRLKNADIRVNAVHPGIVNTGLGEVRNELDQKRRESSMSKWIKRLGVSPGRSAGAIFKILTRDEYKNVNGKYFSGSKIARSSFKSRNNRKQNKIWIKTMEILKKRLDLSFDV